MMTKILFALIIIVLPAFSGAALPENVDINFPANGVSIQGVVEIIGTAVSDSFSSAAVYFSYSGADSTNWFLIARLDQPVENSMLARWDTTTITDGEYQLKLVLNKKDGTTQEVLVSPLYVRNYTAVPTVLEPTLNLTVQAEEATPTSISDAANYATPFPENPASTSVDGLTTSIVVAVVTGILILSVLLAYSYFNGRNRLM